MSETSAKNQYLATFVGKYQNKLTKILRDQLI